MADCTNTAEFLAEWARMHDAQQRDEHGFPKETCTDDNCIGCPLDIGLDCKEFAFRNINHAITKVQKWSDEHPLPPSKTYADVFFEQHPKATRLENGRPRAYRCEVYGCECKYKCPPDVIDSTFNTDRDPCKICWNEPFKEE